MNPVNRRQFLESSLVAAGAVLVGTQAGSAAIAPGVETTASTVLTGEERNVQPDLWVLEVNFKPVRMISVDLPDPITGKTRRQLIWYLAYRAFNRGGNNKSTAVLPKAEDRPVFVPEFTLMTDDNGKQKIYFDRVMPVAQAAINRRERHNYKNSVEIVGHIPPVAKRGAKDEKSLDGVAMWRGVDPSTDHFKVFMGGFSNGYRVEKGPNDEDLLKRKTLMQEFWRPSDVLEQSEEEIRLEKQPIWIYR